jgi:cell division protein FtsB
MARRHRIRRLVLLGIASLLLFGFVLADGGLLSIAWRTVQVRHLEEQVVELEARSAALQREIELRRDDPATIERIAREEYGMIYPGETLIRIIRVSEEEARRVEAARAARDDGALTQARSPSP